MIKMTIQDAEETAEFKVLEKPIIQKPLIAESDVVTIDNNLSTYVTGTQKRELTVGLGYLDSVGYETLRRIRDRQYAVLKYPTVTITADEPIDLGYGEDVPDYRQRLVQLKGKNLFDKNTATRYRYLSDSNGSIMTSTNNYTYAGESYIPCEPNTAYTLSGGSQYMRIAEYTSNKTFVKIVNSQTSSSPITITTGNTGVFLRVSYNDTSLGNAGIQLEKGSIATPYAPYFTPIELCKIGDYQDYIYKSGDKWYVHKETGIKHFSDVNSFVYSNGCFQTNYTFPNDKASQTIAKSDTFTFNPVQSAITSNLENGEFGWNTLNYLTAKNTTLASKADWETWLTSNNPVIYYVLATPTETEITNETLIAQLDALQNSAFDRWTQIETNVQELSLQPYLTVTQGEITGSGKEVMLEGTTEDLLDFVILGDTYQQTYSGKNLFKIDNNSGVWHATISVSSNSISSTCETAGVSYVAVLIPNSDSLLGKTCTISVGGAIPNTSGRNGRVIVADSSSTSLQSVNNVFAQLNNLAITGGSLTFTFPSSYSSGRNCFAVCFYASNAATSTAVGESVTYSDVQIEIGSQATSYEPYVGGAPSPNPDYPQEVQTVNGDIAFDFSGPSGVKRYIMVGKMTLADQRIIDNCGTNEQVQVSFRESKQL